MEENILPRLKLQAKALQFSIIKLSLHEISMLLSKAGTTCFVLELILSDGSRL